ncbi:hypothetical protein ACFWBM_09335 [Streptomyces sp. NPDC059980]|uniref:hypothetical protein n=1 Tax=Streptomyces sp. NPDC059980 TaxID=3347022 RepID=UPI0036A75ACC
MHPQLRTKKDAQTIKDQKPGKRSSRPERAQPLPGRRKEHDPGATTSPGERRVNVSFAIPRITGLSAVGGGSGLIVAVATGNVEPVYVWPCVALAGLGMAYDLGRRVLARPQRH